MNKDKKEFIIGSIILTILILLAVIITLFVLYEKEKRSILSVPENKYNVADYIYIEKVDYSKYANLFKGNLELPKITLKNIDQNIIDDFENKETDILLEIVNCSKLLEEKINDSEYNPVSTINVDMDYRVINDILSIKYILKIDLDFELGTVTKTIFFNYDLNDKVVLSNLELLKKIDYDDYDLSLYLLDNSILKDKNMEDKVIDSISNEEIIIQNIVDNKDEYIDRIIDELNNVDIYVDNDNIVVGYFNNKLINTCYLTNEEEKYQLIEYKQQ